MKKQVGDSFKNLMAEIKWKEERTLDILEANFTKIEKKFENVRDWSTTIVSEADNWLRESSKIMDAFKSMQDENQIAFEMLEDKESELDIIRLGENLLDRLHAEMKSPTPEVQNSIKFLTSIVNSLKVEFDEHLKNKITMFCHVPKLELDESKATSEDKVEVDKTKVEDNQNLMDEPEFHLMDDYEFLNGISAIKKSIIEAFDALMKESK